MPTTADKLELLATTRVERMSNAHHHASRADTACS